MTQGAVLGEDADGEHISLELVETAEGGWDEAQLHAPGPPAGSEARRRARLSSTPFTKARLSSAP